MKVVVDAQRCIASGACVLSSPSVFGQDDDGIVQLYIESPSEALREEVVEAAEACPAAVISVAFEI